eukprot:3065138-Rhodomonas_salina.1
MAAVRFGDGTDDGGGQRQVWRLGAVKGDRFSMSVVNVKEEARLAAPHAFDSRKVLLRAADYCRQPRVQGSGFRVQGSGFR